MERSAFFTGLFLGNLLGMGIAILIAYSTSFIPGWKLNQIKEVRAKIELCEKHLPRSQKCVIMVQPDPNYSGPANDSR